MAYAKKIETTRVTLPSDDKYWVEVKKEARYGDLVKGGAVGKDGSPDFFATGAGMLLQMIVDWNLDDEQGNILPINEENVAMLENQDAMALFDATRNIEVDTPEQKKSSTKKSS